VGTGGFIGQEHICGREGIAYKIVSYFDREEEEKEGPD
jgi:hypothetical protein